jgi:hypothetical protein
MGIDDVAIYSVLTTIAFWAIQKAWNEKYSKDY